jgi:hypothetical protein
VGPTNRRTDLILIEECGTVFLSNCESITGILLTILRNAQRDCHSHQVC